MPIEREDLDRAIKDIKTHIDLRLSPIKEKQDEHHKSLYDSAHGVVNKVRELSTGVKIVQWLVGALGISFIIEWFKRHF